MTAQTPRPREATQEMLDAPLRIDPDVMLRDGRVISGKQYESRRDLRAEIWRAMWDAFNPDAGARPVAGEEER